MTGPGSVGCRLARAGIVGAIAFAACGIAVSKTSSALPCADIVRAQAPTATPPTTPSSAPTMTAGATAPATVEPTPPIATPAPPPIIAGRWSITRTWYRQCPACSRVVTLTTPWTITQTGGEVRVDRGLRGAVVDDGVGGGYLNLEGFESSGPLTLRFWYATLRVSPDGNVFEGTFNGSEVLQNPCGERPPSVTCFASSGWLRAQRIEPLATGTAPPGLPTPPGPPTPAGPPTPLSSATTAPPTPTTGAAPTPGAATPTSTAPPTATGTASPMPSPSSTNSPRSTAAPSATATSPPPRRFMPWAGG